MDEIDVAVVGCGYVANGHLEAWRKAPQARVVAVSDINETLAKDTAKFWQIPKYYTSLSELLKDGMVNLVDICTPPHTHADLAIQAMNVGVNVLIEKPMTMTVTDAEKIVNCQKTTGVKAGVLHNWLFDDPVLQADSLVRTGCLGEIINAEIEALNTKFDSMVANERHWCHRFPGGRFSEMLAHPIYLLRHFLGDVKLASVHVSKVGDYPWMKSDELCAIFKAGSKLGRAYASFNSSRDAIFINLYGQKAILKIDVINSTITFLPTMKNSRFSKGFDSLRQATQLTKSAVKNAVKVVSRRWMSGHDMYIRLFAESLLKNTEPPVTLEEGLAVIRILEEMCMLIDKMEKNLK